MTPGQRAWLFSTNVEAVKSGHIWPQMAASEAALESNYGQSALAREANNLFGMKQHAHPVYGTLVLPTREFANSEWKVVDARWVEYETPAECFIDRMQTLERLRTLPGFEHYNNALNADTPKAYVTEVSLKWSSDPNRAQKVIDIYDAVFPGGANSEAVQDALTGEN